MRAKVYNAWNDIRQTFWVVPSMMCVGAVLLALGMIYVDQNFAKPLPSESFWAWLLHIKPEGAHQFLSAVASSMIGVAGISFSITIVALTLASNQFGPRLLRSFMRDWGNQVALGTFISTFLYCLLILQWLRYASKHQAVLLYSVHFALLLTFFSIGVLIYFFHHISTQIQAEYLVAQLGKELNATIDRLFSGEDQEEQRSQHEEALQQVPDNFEEEAEVLQAPRSGYVQAIDHESLLSRAQETDLLLEVRQKPGHFVVKDGPLLRVWPPDSCDDELKKSLVGDFIIGSKPSIEQDVRFAILQLVEVAVRSLSPGINDPFTAINCIDTLSNSLFLLAKCNLPDGHRRDQENKLRLIVPSRGFSDFLEIAFNQIRQNARGSVAVRIRLLEALAVIGTHLKQPEDLEAVREHAEMIKQGSQREGVLEQADQEQLQQRYELVIKALGQDDIDKVA